MTCLVIRAVESFVIKTDWVDRSHDKPSWSQRTVMDSVVPYLCNFFYRSPHYPRRHVGRTVIGTPVRRGSSFQNTSTLKSGYWDRLSELHDGTTGRAVLQVRHKVQRVKFSSEVTQFVTVRCIYDGPSCGSVTKYRELIPVPIFQELKCFGTETLDGPLCL